MTIQFLVMGFEKPGMIAQTAFRHRKTEARRQVFDLGPSSSVRFVGGVCRGKNQEEPG